MLPLPNERQSMKNKLQSAHATRAGVTVVLRDEHIFVPYGGRVPNTGNLANRGSARPARLDRTPENWTGFVLPENFTLNRQP